MESDNISYVWHTVCCRKRERLAKGSTKNMPVRGDFHRALWNICNPAAGMLCQPKWKGRLFNKNFWKQFWHQRVNLVHAEFITKDLQLELDIFPLCWLLCDVRWIAKKLWFYFRQRDPPSQIQTGFGPYPAFCLIGAGGTLLYLHAFIINFYLFLHYISAEGCLLFMFVCFVCALCLLVLQCHYLMRAHYDLLCMVHLAVLF